jgi:hypothetical protein
LNIIGYLFCERLFGHVLLIEKSVAEKVRQTNRDKKSAAEKVQQKKYGRKIATEKVRQKNHSRKSVAKKSWQQHGWDLFMRDMVHLV